MSLQSLRLNAERACASIAAILLGAMFALVIADVLGRYFLDAPIAGSDELVGMLMGLAISFSLPAATAARRHIVVGIIDDIPGVGTENTIGRIADIATIAGFVLIAYVMFEQIRSMMRFNHVSQALHIPLSIFAIVLGGSALASASLIAVRIFSKPDSDQNAASEPK